MSENEEKGIIINNIDVTECNSIIFEHHDGRAVRRNVCECGLQGVEYYNMMCSYNPECYYKQLQIEKQKKEKTEKTLKEIEETVKHDCVVTCEYSARYEFKECCEKGCLNTEILEKIKEAKNDN